MNTEWDVSGRSEYMRAPEMHVAGGAGHPKASDTLCWPTLRANCRIW